MSYINVIIDNKSRSTDTFYTYKTKVDLPIGTVVWVPFGRGNKPKLAVVVGKADEFTGDYQVKSIKEVNREFYLNKEMVETALWMKSRYAIRYIDALRLFFPSGKLPKRKQKNDYIDGIMPEIMEFEQLTKEQKLAIDEILPYLEKPEHEAFLIYGVTGSGKTEVYMRTIARALELGKSAIYLVPEITLAGQTLSRLAGRFGKDRLAVLHSKMTNAQRYVQWQRIATGEADIVVGSRSAVFAPAHDIGVIVVDEEQDSSYKSDMLPHYETIDIAYKRTSSHKGIMILGSGTPSVTSYFRAKQGIYRLIQMKERYNSSPMPTMTVVDMREEMREGNAGIFSSRLFLKMEETLSSGQQVLLFINRRGYSNYISCRNCGSTIKCQECDIPMTYHKGLDKCICHYCGRKKNVPDVCDECGNGVLSKFGFGTEQVQEVANTLFPECKIDRLDMDTAKSVDSIENTISEFKLGLTDILVGTQIIAKSLDFKNVGLVGIMSADVSLNAGDYRGGEQTYQLITQVAGRAGRGDESGEVLIQTFEPDNYAVKAAAGYDYEGFYQREIRYRTLLSYPPISDLFQISITGKSGKLCNEYLHLMRRDLVGNELFKELVILDSIRDYYFKGDGVQRWNMTIKCPRHLRSELIKICELYSRKLVKEKTGCHLITDVNPY